MERSRGLLFSRIPPSYDLAVLAANSGDADDGPEEQIAASSYPPRRPEDRLTKSVSISEPNVGHRVRLGNRV